MVASNGPSPILASFHCKSELTARKEFVPAGPPVTKAIRREQSTRSAVAGL